MKNCVFRTLFLVAVSILSAASGVAGQTKEKLALQVRAAETAFAKTMAERDLDGFLSHIADEAVFMGNNDALRGIEAVKTGYRQSIDAAGAPPQVQRQPVVAARLNTFTLRGY